MSGNTQPQFTKSGLLATKALASSITANTKSDGAGTLGTDIFLLVTAPTDDCFIEFIRLMPYATAAATNTTATVARFYVSTVGSSTTTSADTHLIAEVSLGVQAADSSTAAVSPIDVPLNIRVPSGSFIHVSMHAAPAANTGWQVAAFGGNY